MNAIKTCQHRKEPELGYMNWHSDAARRHRKGERQLYCPYCLKWIWQSYYNKP